MATNGKDGMTPSMNFSGNIPDKQEEGVFGYLQNRGTKNTFSKDYWRENTGYLDSALKDLKEMQKLYNELEKSSGKMTSSQEKTFKTQKRALELQLATLKDIKDVKKIIIPRFEVGGRWFDDVVNNDRYRQDQIDGIDDEEEY